MAYDHTLPFAYMAGDPVAHLSFVQDMREFLREQMACHSEEEFFDWLNSQDDEDREHALALICEPAFTLNDHQIIPNVSAQAYHVEQQGKVRSFTEWAAQPKKQLFDKSGKPQKWRKIFMRMGRGAGKTHAASTNVHDFARYLYPGLTGMLVGPTTKDVREVMIEGESGLLKTAPADFMPEYQPGYARVVWPNGSRAIIYTADDPESIRGPSLYWAWGDELAKWRDERSLKNLNRTLRNKHPAGNRMILTTSPLSSQKWVRDIEKQHDTITIVASSFDNRVGLDEGAIEDWEREIEAGGRAAREEYFAEWQNDSEKLWTLDELEGLVQDKKNQIALNDMCEKMDFRILTIDPGGKTDETGIILLGPQGKKKWVLGDFSLEAGHTKARWLDKVEQIANEYMQGGDYILVETNVHQGADEDIRSRCPTMRVEPIHQNQHTGSKIARAQTAQVQYDAGSVVHFRYMPQLHTQMDEFYEVVDDKKRSPDRVDALANGMKWLAERKRPSILVWNVGPTRFDF